MNCASLDVPLDYADPSGQTITILLNEHPARRSDERIGALLINPGGPGGSGLDFNRSFSLPDDVRDHYDIIGFDPRGVGVSNPVTCGSDTVPPFRALDSSPSTPEAQQALDDAAKAIADDCGTHAGDLLPHVGTDDVVRDMDTIRAGLGEDTISYLGASYGTLLGLRYAALFPTHIHSMVLDGVVDPTQDFEAFLRQQTIAFETQLSAVFDQCASGPSCPPGGAAAAYDQVDAELQQAPIPTRNGNALDPGELPVAALIPAYEPSAARQLYQGLTQALKGDATTLVGLFEAYEQSASYASYAAVECTDSPHPTTATDYAAFAAQLEALSPRFGGAVANELLPCAFWPAPVHDVTGPVAAPDSPPILVIGNTKDAATPYQQAVDVANTLAHGRLLTLDGAGHTAIAQGSSCIDDAVAAYYVDGTLPAEGKVCT